MDAALGKSEKTEADGNPKDRPDGSHDVKILGRSRCRPATASFLAAEFRRAGEFPRVGGLLRVSEFRLVSASWRAQRALARHFLCFYAAVNSDGDGSGNGDGGGSGHGHDGSWSWR